MGELQSERALATGRAHHLAARQRSRSPSGVGLLPSGLISVIRQSAYSSPQTLTFSGQILMISGAHPRPKASPPLASTSARPRTSMPRGAPGRKHIVDHDGRPTLPGHVGVLLRAGQGVAADVDGLQLVVEAEADRNDLRRTVIANGGQAAEALGP